MVTDEEDHGEDKDDEGAVESDAFEVLTELATDEEVDDDDDDENGDEVDEVDDSEINKEEEDDKLDEAEEDDVEEDDVSNTDSEMEATLVGDGSFVQPLLVVEESYDKVPVDVVPGEADMEDSLEIEEVTSKQQKAPGNTQLVLPSPPLRLSTKLDHPLDRMLVSLSLCASLAVIDWAPQLMRPWTTAAPAGSRWVAVLLLLVWIPVVH
ncbi:hypothetical protein SEUCBS139899_001983 [Sporothrix eucalyptigena]|uniref:Uncharacterized protein n=1 Tax=Sporothrix eucalyptigena TaxID=1812306 RepID=A0ABP0CLP5_9PEZI